MKNSPANKIKSWIRPLPERLVNKIAAGEVIERPAAVLKELVENSLDAGAGRIEVIVEKSGTKLITVIDDGCGINAEQLEIAFARHATSKISNFDDLDNLRSYGFRGEALPSIGSVSRTRMITRTTDADAGTEIYIEGGVVQKVKPTASPKGTTVEVNDLFYNTPARRKFLKAESTEARHLTRNAIALALGAPDVRFAYKINGRQLFSLDEQHRDMNRRTAALLLGNNKDSLIEVRSESTALNMRAYLSSPENARQNQNSLYVFINKRFIKSASIVHAVKIGYGELLPKGNYPIGAVFLEIDPGKVDVNVHPTKAEVRLSQERQIHDIVYQAVKRTLRGEANLYQTEVIKSDSTATRMTADEAIRRARAYRSPTEAQTVIKEMYDNQNASSDSYTRIGDSEIFAQAETVKTTLKEISSTGHEIEAGRLIYIGCLSELYLLFKQDSNLILVDQHAAHERILFEEILKAMEHGAATSQNLLFPVNIELSPERFALYEESQKVLTSIGFVIEPFGTSAVLLSAVPISLSRKSPEKVFGSILEDVENLQKAGYELKKAVAESMACRAAVMAGDRLTEEEALQLFRQLLKSENKHSCPHGRPTFLKISKNELDAKFGRK